MISFNKFWNYIAENNITQYELINHHKVSTSTLHRLRNNEIVDTSTIGQLCDILCCQPGDIMENLPIEQVKPKEPGKKGRKKAQS